MEDEDDGAGGNRNKATDYPLNKRSRRRGGGKGHVLLWTAQHRDSLGVIMINWSLIDCLSLQDLQSTFVLSKAFVAMLSPPSFGSQLRSYSQVA